MMRPEPGQVLHFSEDSTITRFVPHVAKTAQQPEPYVWAVHWDRAPDYWFPRQCPRAMAWRAPWSTDEDVQAILGPSATGNGNGTSGRNGSGAPGGDGDGARGRNVDVDGYRAHLTQPVFPIEPAQPAHLTRRVHAVEYGWLEAIRTTQLYAYRFAEEDFRPFGDPNSAHAMVCEHEVAPLGPPERVGDLFTLHHEAGIELRVLPTLWPFWDAVVTSTLDFSGIRLRNALPRTHLRPE